MADNVQVIRGGPGRAATYRLAGVPKTFDRAGLIKFLSTSPKQALRLGRDLAALNRGILNDAGYQVKTVNGVQHLQKYKGGKVSQQGAGGKSGGGAWGPGDEGKPMKWADLGALPKRAGDPKGTLGASNDTNNGTPPKPTKPAGGTSPNGGTGGTSPNGGTDTRDLSGSDTESNNSGLFDQIAGLDPNTGAPMTRGMIDAIINGTYNPQLNEVRREIGKNPAQLKTNLGNIERWYGDVFKSVDTARERGASMTKSAADATTGNAKAILESIGGSAALGAQGVAQSGANAAGTIQALGAVDQSYLSDIQPLLKGEAANASTRETARMGDLLQGYKQKLSDLALQKGGARASGLAEMLKYNSGQEQQAFTNKVGLIQTAGALALDNAKAQNYLADQQAKSDKATASGNKTILSTIQKANAQANQYGYDPAELYAQYPKGGLAPGELVSNVLNTYRANSLPLTDPRVRSAAAALIQTYGYKVDPKWVNGWR